MEEVQNENEINYKFGKDIKIIIVGNLSTGKTSIINRYMKDNFEEHCRATIAPEFSFKIIKINGINFRLQFWDLPGQERVPIVTSLFCKDSNAVVFCCEVKNDKSRKDIIKWVKTLSDNIDLENIPKILVENKCDLFGDEEKYNEGIEELKEFSNNNNFSGCFRTSALNGYNIENAIKFLVNEIINSFDEEDINSYREGNSSIINLNNKTTKSSFISDSKRCC